ncbi:unnamed protein product [Mortierella alpina]
MQVAAEPSGQPRLRLDLTQLEARIKALTALRAERLQPVDDSPSSVPSPTITSSISTRLVHSQPSKNPGMEVMADLLNGSRSVDLQRTPASHRGNARESDNDNLISTESRSSFEDSRSEDFHPRHLSAVQREIHSLHASLEQSKLESLRLQQRLLEKIDLERPQGRGHAISSSMYMEQGAHQNLESRIRMRRRHEQPGQGSDPRQPRSEPIARTRHHSNRHHRPQEQVGTTKESSESGASFSSSAAHWRDRQVRRTSNSGPQPMSLSYSNSSDLSEYRHSGTHAPEQFKDAVQPSLFPKLTFLSQRRKGHVLKRLFKHCTKALSYLVIFSAVQVLLMGLLFRPSYNPDHRPTNEFQHVPTTISFRGREYVADQRGFFTFLDAGFGTETLAYCHDLWDFTSDPRVMRQLQQAPILHRVLDAVAHLGAVAADTVMALVHELSLRV